MMLGMIALFVRHEVPNLSAVAWHHQDGSLLLGTYDWKFHGKKKGGTFMTKNELRVSINKMKIKIQENEEIYQKLEEELEALTEFGNQCDWRIRAFESSMEMRKQKLRSLDGLSGSVRAASKYQAKMNEMLTGTEYQATISSIDALMGSVGEQKRKVQQDILNQESYIRSLKRKLEQMQYEYNSWEEEVSVNGSE